MLPVVLAALLVAQAQTPLPPPPSPAQAPEATRPVGDGSALDAAEPGEPGEPGAFRFAGPSAKPALSGTLPTVAASPKAPRPDVITETSIAPAKPRLAPWVGLGAGAVFAIAGGVFLAQTMSAVDSIPDRPSNPNLMDEYEEQMKEAQTNITVNAIGTSVFFSSTAAAWIVSGLLLLDE